MSQGYNKVILMGNLVGEPVWRETSRGGGVCVFSLGVNRQSRDDAGNVREEAAFIDVEAWGRQGEAISRYCKKGSALLVEGRLRFEQWEDRESGRKRSRLKVVLEAFRFLNSKRDSDASGGGESAVSDRSQDGRGVDGGEAPQPSGRAVDARASGDWVSEGEEVPF